MFVLRLAERKKGLNRNKKIALITCILLCVAVTVSFAFVVLQTDHHCTGEQCHICAEILACKTLLRNLAGAVLTLPVIVSVCSANHIHSGEAVFFTTATPILLKVKLTI